MGYLDAVVRDSRPLAASEPGAPPARPAFSPTVDLAVDAGLEDAERLESVEEGGMPFELESVAGRSVARPARPVLAGADVPVSPPAPRLDAPLQPFVPDVNPKPRRARAARADFDDPDHFVVPPEGSAAPLAPPAPAPTTPREPSLRAADSAEDVPGATHQALRVRQEAGLAAAASEDASGGPADAVAPRAPFPQEERAVERATRNVLDGREPRLQTVQPSDSELTRRAALPATRSASPESAGSELDRAVPRPAPAKRSIPIAPGRSPRPVERDLARPTEPDFAANRAPPRARAASGAPGVEAVRDVSSRFAPPDEAAAVFLERDPERGPAVPESMRPVRAVGKRERESSSPVVAAVTVQSAATIDRRASGERAPRSAPHERVPSVDQPAQVNHDRSRSPSWLPREAPARATEPRLVIGRIDVIVEAPPAPQPAAAPPAPIASDAASRFYLRRL